MKTLKKTHFVLIGVIMCMLLIAPDVMAASCPLGPDVTKDLYGALKIIRIVAPLLVIAYSTLDTVKALTKGDGGAELKKVAQRFGKRCIYAVILFFLPMLVDLFMQMADVWDSNGNCLEEVEKASSTSEGNTTTAYNKCATKTSQESCDRTGGCNWKNGACLMVEINGVTNPTTKSAQTLCQEQGMTWDANNNMCIRSNEQALCASFDGRAADCQNNNCAFNYSNGQCSPK